jgi:hypothetical protein
LLDELDMSFVPDFMPLLDEEPKKSQAK